MSGSTSLEFVRPHAVALFCHLRLPFDEANGSDALFFTSRQLAEAGAHVVMAVRNPKAAHDLIQTWQTEWSGMGLPLDIEVS